MTETDYTAKDITVLEGLEPVRLRPGMYIGSTGLRGLHQLVHELIDNAVDEALAGRNDRIEVTLHPDHSVTVQDWGSGIPVDVMPEQAREAAKLAAGIEDPDLREYVAKAIKAALARPPDDRSV